MSPATFAPLVQNAALLLALFVVYDLATSGRRPDPGPLRQVLAGATVGAIAIAIMLAAVVLEPGVVFDTRSVLLAVTGLFLGAVPTAIAVAMTVVLRLFQGGVGAGVGASVALASGGIGLAWRYWRRKPLEDASWRELYALGLVVHVVMLALTLALPWESARHVLGHIGAPVLLVYPVATAALGMLLASRLRRERGLARLAESEERFRVFFDDAPLGKSMTAPDGRLERANPAFCRLLGYSADELARLPFDAVTHPDDLAESREGARSLLDGERDTWSMEKRYLTKDGRTIWTRVDVALARDGAGRPLHFLTHVQDISERKSSEEELRRMLAEADASRRALLSMIEDQKRTTAALQLQTTALEAAANSIVITDREGRIEWVNPAFSLLTGYSREECLGRNPRELVRSGKHPESFYKELWDTILTGKVWRGEMFNRRKDGGLYSEEQTITPVPGGDGRIAHFIAVKQDVTERKRAEQERQALDAKLRQAQKMESVGRLAGGVAHDYNNALGVILGRAELALHGLEPGAPLRRHVEAIREAAVRSADLTRQLMAFARKQTISFRVLDLNDAVTAGLRMLKQLIGEDARLEWTPGDALWPVKADPVQVQQVLSNLLVNARDAIAGPGEIRIETRNVVMDEAACSRLAGCAPGDYVRLSVADDGCGMDERVLDQLFEPFFTTKPLGRGTGLGLATVYGIVQQHGGQIEVSSEPGKGTTFRIYLPRVAGQPSTLGAGAASEPRGRGETVLLVEDEPALLEVGSETLTDLGYRVLTAGGPAAALILAEAHSDEIDLLLTDLVMPDMNGRELAERMLAGRPGMRCLFVSGYAADVMARRGVRSDDARLLQKPFSRLDLAIRVRQALDS